MTNAARIAAQQATEQQAALRQATEFQSKAIEQQAAVAAASVQEAARRHAESIAQAVAQQQMKLQTASTSSLIQAPPPHASTPHAPTLHAQTPHAPAPAAEGEPLDEKERREAERLSYEQREATRREAERKQWDEMERERREAERRAFAEQFESTRREFERQEALRRRELELELRLQQERLASLPLGHAVELAAPTVPTNSCASLGQSSGVASSVYASVPTASGSLGVLGHRQPPAPPPQAAAYHYALSALGAEAVGASSGAAPGAYAAPPMMIVRPARRSRPSSAASSSSKRTKTPTRCTGSYRLAADSMSYPTGGSSASCSHLSLTIPAPYEIGAGMMHAGGVQYRAAPMGPAVVFGAHQQPPEYLQLWMAPAKSPQRAPPIRSHRSADQLDPQLVGVRLIKPGAKPGAYRKQPRRPEPQIVFP